jgi:mediator of RNA polymerase II transcription subunit 14
MVVSLNVLSHHCFTDQNEKFPGKRKSGGRQEPGSRRTKHPAYFIPELAHVVALCDERIPFVTLAQEVSINIMSDVLNCPLTI